MKKLFPLLALLICVPCFAQNPWSSVLSSSRAINWQSAGLPSSFTDKGGSNVETTTNPWTPPTRTQSGSTISPSGNATTDLTNINAALASCTDGHYVLLGAGTFLIQGEVVMYTNSCTLRGSGANLTILSVSGSGDLFMGQAGTGGSCNLTSGSNYAAGSTSISCNGLTGGAPTVGAIAVLTQCNTGYSGATCATGSGGDNGGLYVCADGTCNTEGTASIGQQYQNFVVTSVSNAGGTYTVGFTPSLYMPNWSYAQTPTLTWNNTGYNGIGVGLEDMTIYNGWVNSNDTYASWIRGVKFVASGASSPLSLNQNLNDLISNNYFFLDTGLDSSYAPGAQMYTTTASLILNNIFTGTTEPLESFGGNVGDVFAYNIGRDSFTDYSFNQTYDHHAYSSFDLFEGNQMTLDEDDTWGTHDLNTYFRNYSPCFDAPYSTFASGTYGIKGIEIDNYQRFENVIGNTMGTLSQCPNYVTTSSTGIYTLPGGDALTGASLMRWGNVSVVTQGTDTPANSGIRFVSGEVPNTTNMPAGTYPNAVTWQNSTPSGTTLACSYFLTGSSTSCTPKYSGGTGLSWWKVCKTWSSFPTSCSASQTQPFPLAGPDITSGPYVNGYAYDTPAAVAWEYLPIDTTYQNSYTITASSWSGQVETLTVSGLPASNQHVMGAFQLSGVNAACSTGATFGGNSEILMTGSSTTQITYALPSNPSLSCTGTMKFPDVRQFDERVYQSDPASSSPTLGNIFLSAGPF